MYIIFDKLMINNGFQFIGNVGAEPEITIYNDKRYAKISIAVNEKYKNNKNEIVKNTYWFHVTFTRENTIDFIKEYIKKGYRVIVNGKIKTSIIINNDKKTTYTNFIGNEIMIINNKEDKQDDTEDNTEDKQDNTEDTTTEKPKENMTIKEIYGDDQREEVPFDYDDDIPF